MLGFTPNTYGTKLSQKYKCQSGGREWYAAGSHFVFVVKTAFHFKLWIELAETDFQDYNLL